MCVCSSIYSEWPWTIDSSHLHINLSPAQLDSPVPHYLALLSLTSPSLSPHLPFILSLPLLFSACDLTESVGCVQMFLTLIRSKNVFSSQTRPNETELKLHAKTFSLCMCSLFCCRVSPERGQSSWITVCPVSQQPRALPLSTQLPPSNPQGEPRPEGAWRWPPHGKCLITLCAGTTKNCFCEQQPSWFLLSLKYDETFLKLQNYKDKATRCLMLW